MLSGNFVLTLFIVNFLLIVRLKFFSWIHGKSSRAQVMRFATYVHNITLKILTLFLSLKS